MAQAPTYKDIETNRKQQQMVANEMNQMQNTRGNLDNEMNSQKNAILQNYMNAQSTQQGLGDPRQYVNQAVGAANQTPNQDAYSEAMVQGAIDGKVNPQDVLNDPSINDSSKSVLLSLLSGGPQNEQAPIGLVPPM